MKSEGEETPYNLIALILNKIRLKKVNRFIHVFFRNFTILFDDLYDFAV